MNVKQLECKIVSALVHQVLANGLLVTVFDGEDNLIEKSDNYDNIMSICFLADAIIIRLYNANQNYLGYIACTYDNNGWDTISEYSGNLEILLEPIFSKIEEGNI